MKSITGPSIRGSSITIIDTNNKYKRDNPKTTMTQIILTVFSASTFLDSLDSLDLTEGRAHINLHKNNKIGKYQENIH